MDVVAEIALAGVLGALIGSFLNVVIHRLPRGESLVRPRSRCPGCGGQIASYDNVPVLSWLLLRGRCRRCGAPISPRYPLVELLTALAFAAVVLVRGLDDDLLLAAVIAYPRGMGMGDVKLAGAMGLFLGLSVIPALLVAFLSGSVVGLAILAREGAAGRKKAIPFGVFLALGGIVGVLAGPELVDLYETNFLE